MGKTSRKTIEQASEFLRLVQKKLEIEFDENQIIVDNTRRRAAARAARAALKNSLKGDPKHLIDTYSAVSESLRKVGIEHDPEKPWNKGRIWIFVAGLFAHYPQPVEPYKGSFGKSCWLLQQEIRRQSPDAKGVERRFHTLLDTAFENVQSPVATLLRQMKSKYIAVNYPQLLTDLHWWDGIDKRVQDKWARDFWRVPSSSSELSEAPADEDSE